MDVCGSCRWRGDHTQTTATDEYDRKGTLNQSKPSAPPDTHTFQHSTTRFLDAADAAAHLGGLNSRTVTRWAREGYLPAYPIGEGKRRLWRFLRTDLDVWMSARRTGVPA